MDAAYIMHAVSTAQPNEINATAGNSTVGTTGRLICAKNSKTINKKIGKIPINLPRMSASVLIEKFKRRARHFFYDTLEGRVHLLEHNNEI